MTSEISAQPTEGHRCLKTATLGLREMELCHQTGPNEKGGSPKSGSSLDALGRADATLWSGHTPRNPAQQWERASGPHGYSLGARGTRAERVKPSPQRSHAVGFHLHDILNMMELWEWRTEQCQRGVRDQEVGGWHGVGRSRVWRQEGRSCSAQWQGRKTRAPARVLEVF